MIKITNVKPLWDKVITTMNKNDFDVKTGELIDIKKLSGSVKEYQTVVAVGPMVHNINVGDTVIINPTAYGKPKQVKDAGNGSLRQDIEGYHVEMEYQFPTIEIDGVEHLFINAKDIDVVCTVIETEDTDKKIFVPETKIIV